MDYLNNTVAEVDKVEELASGAYDSSFYASPGETALGLFMCAAMLATAFHMSHRYTVGEREELEEAERRRIEAENVKEREIETFRSKIAKILEGYAIHLTNITSRSPLSRSSHNSVQTDLIKKSDSTRQISEGKEDEGIRNDTISVSSDSSDEVVEDIEAASTGTNNNVIYSLLTTGQDTTCTVIRPTLTKDVDNQIEDDTTTSQPSSTSNRSKITRTSLREAVTDNPCAICLEPFRPGDDVVFCSNNVNGQTPHAFHRECSYDYIINHPGKIQAPCPMCRTLLLPPEEQRRGCFKSSQTLALPQLEEDESDSVGNSEESNSSIEV